MYQLSGAVQAVHFAQPVVKVVPVRLCEIVEFVARHIHAACCDLMQFGLPHMRACLVNEGDVRLPLASQRVAKTGGQLQPGRSAPDNHDSVGGRLGFRGHLQILRFVPTCCTTGTGRLLFGRHRLPVVRDHPDTQDQCRLARLPFA